MGRNDDRAYTGAHGIVLEADRSPSAIHGLDIATLVDLFQSFGYDCKPAGQLRGISGSLHSFDFVCVNRQTGEKIVLQSILHLENDGENFDVEIVKLRLSTYDCCPDACLVVASEFTEKVKQLASLYKLTAIDTRSGENPYEQIRALLTLQSQN
jgi:hypothetical protein